MSGSRAIILAAAALACSSAAPSSMPAAAPPPSVVVVTSTIQAAVDAARPGGTVVIPPGVYRESVVITTDRLTLRAAPGTVLDGAGLTGADCLRVTAPTGARLTGADCLRVTAPTGARLTGFELDGLTVRNFNRNGVFLRDVDNYRITGTVTRNDLDYGIFPVRTSRGRIDHTTSSGSLDTGLYIGQSTDIELDHNVETGNTIGIDAEASDRVHLHLHLHHNLATRNAIGAVAQVVPGLSRTTTDGTVIDHNVFTANNAANPSTDPNDLLTRLPNGLGLLVVATDHTTVQDKIITANQTTVMAVVQLPPDIAAFDPRIDPFPNNVHVTGNIVTGMPTTRPRRTLVPRRTSCGTPPDSATAGRGISPTAPCPPPSRTAEHRSGRRRGAEQSALRPRSRSGRPGRSVSTSRRRADHCSLRQSRRCRGLGVCG